MVVYCGTYSKSVWSVTWSRVLGLHTVTDWLSVLRLRVDNVTVGYCCLHAGLIATIAILGNGIWQMRTGNQMKSQKMMRWRVLAQGFTVAALVGGAYYAGIKDKKEWNFKIPFWFCLISTTNICEKYETGSCGEQALVNLNWKWLDSVWHNASFERFYYFNNHAILGPHMIYTIIGSLRDSHLSSFKYRYCFVTELVIFAGSV